MVIELIIYILTNYDQTDETLFVHDNGYFDEERCSSADSYINYDLLSLLYHQETTPDRQKNYGTMDSTCNRQSQDTRRYTFSTVSSTVHTKDLIELVPTLSEIALEKKETQTTAFFWMDIEDPTNEELKYLQDIFNIHPLIIEDIATQDPREKCDRFKNYIFISFRTFQSNPYSINHLQPLGLYILLFKEYILTFHYGAMIHPSNVRKRISHLRDHLKVTAGRV